MAQKKMGRPKSDNPLKYEFKAAVDAVTNARALQYCKDHGIGRAAFVRTAIIELLKSDK